MQVNEQGARSDDDIPQYMTLFQYILSPFGLTLRHKTWDNIFFGISLTIFSVFVLTFVASLTQITPWYIFVMKLIIFCCIATFVMIYIKLKANLSKIIVMYDEICVYETKYNLKTTTFDTTLIAFVLCFVVSYVLMIFDILSNKTFSAIFNNNEVLLTLFYTHVSFSSLFVLLFRFSVQFIISRLCYRYYCLFKFYEKSIDVYLQYRPDFILRYRIEQILVTILKTKKSFDTTVRPINKCQIVITLSLNIFFIFRLITDTHINLVVAILQITQLVLVNTNFVIGLVIVHVRKQTQDRLLYKIFSWKENSLDSNYKFKGTLKCSL